MKEVQPTKQKFLSAEITIGIGRERFKRALVVGIGTFALWSVNAGLGFIFLAMNEPEIIKKHPLVTALLFFIPGILFSGGTAAIASYPHK